MSDGYVIVQSRVEDAGSISSTHLVSGPGGVIEVNEDGTGHLSARLRTGYVISDESEEQVLEQALRAVKTLLGHD